MAGHEVEDVDFPGLTPWELDALRIGIAAASRHGYRVTVELPDRGAGLSPARPTPPWGGYEAVEPNERGKPPLGRPSDAELARALNATPEEIAEVRKRWPVWSPPAPAVAADDELAREVMATPGIAAEIRAREASPVLVGTVRTSGGNMAGCDCPECTALRAPPSPRPDYVRPAGFLTCPCLMCTAAREGRL